MSTYWTTREKLAEIIEGSMTDIASAIALDHGWMSKTVHDEGLTYQFPDDDDRLRALRESVPLASVFVALCKRCWVEPGTLVTQAAEGLPPLPMHRLDGGEGEN